PRRAAPLAGQPHPPDHRAGGRLRLPRPRRPGRQAAVAPGRGPRRRLDRPRPPPHAIRPRGDGRRHPPGGQPRAAAPRGPRRDRSGRTADRAGEPRGAAPEGVRLSSAPKGELTHVFETAWTSAVNLLVEIAVPPGGAACSP